MMTARLRRLQPQLPPGTRVVAITVDPAHDTPVVLRDYADTVGAGGNWRLLTGERQSLYDLAVRGFKLEAMEMPPGTSSGDGPFLHSSKLALVDGAGNVRGYYDSADDEAGLRLLHDARALQAAP